MHELGNAYFASCFGHIHVKSLCLVVWHIAENKMSVVTDLHLALCQVTYVCCCVNLSPDNDGDEPAGVVSTSSDGHHRPALLLRRDAGHERQELDADAAGAL